MKFNYSNIESREFEELCRDLISKKEGIEFHTFASGKDGGIDGRYQTKNGDIIIQAKHYISSTISNLKTTVREQKKKLDIIKPIRYIFITSYSLSVENINEIYGILKNYVSDKQDIIGQSMIDKMIENNPEILLKHPNLWWNYTTLTQLIKPEIYGNNRFEIEEMESKLERLVWCHQYTEALTKIEKERILVITGMPGIGKTVLGTLIAFKYAVRGYKIIKDFTENIEKINVLINKNEKNIIFIDDFLGANILEYFKGSNSGNELIRFINKMKKDDKQIVVLTTRSQIFKEAINLADKFDQLQLTQKNRNFTIELNNYTNNEKAEILYRHLQLSKIEKKDLETLIKNKNYWNIIKHKNYFPRIIEFITEVKHFEEEKYSSYYSFMLEKLENPEKLWGKPFINLENDLKIFLLTVYSFGKSIDKEKLEEAYDERIGELKNTTLQFDQCLEILEGGFIKISISKDSKNYIDFINPSLRDFFIKKLSNNIREYKKIIKKITSIEQLKYINSVLESEEQVNDMLDIVLSLNLEKINIDKEDQINFFRNGLRSSCCLKIKKRIEEKIVNLVNSDLEKYFTKLLFVSNGSIPKEITERMEEKVYKLILNNNLYLEGVKSLNQIEVILSILKNKGELEVFLKENYKEIENIIEKCLRDEVCDYDFHNFYNFLDDVENILEQNSEDDIIKDTFSLLVQSIYEENLQSLEKYFNCKIFLEVILDELDSINIEQMVDWNKLKRYPGDDFEYEEYRLEENRTAYIDNKFRSLLKD